MKALLAACAIATFATASFACGTCVEDKVAATYDYAVVQDAARSGKSIVYCEVQGAFVPDRLAAAARRVRGVDPASVRVSREPAALSFALDTRTRPVREAMKDLQSRSGAARVAVVRVDAAH